MLLPFEVCSPKGHKGAGMFSRSVPEMLTGPVGICGRWKCTSVAEAGGVPGTCGGQ